MLNGDMFTVEVSLEDKNTDRPENCIQMGVLYILVSIV